MVKIFIGGNAMTDMRREIIETCLWLRSCGYVHGTWGNVSVRDEDGTILITPSKIEYALMTPEDIVVIDISGKLISGIHPPTSERDVHRCILNKRPDIGAIIHSHSVYAMAASSLDEGIPPVTEEMCQLLAGGIPLSRSFVPSSKHKELGEVAAVSIGNANALLMRNHGAVCCGRDIKEARICCQIVEKAAQIYLHLCRCRHFNVISDEWVKDGRDYYTNSYGKT
jgi:L-fuculose-phosphate aldolase